MVDLHFTYRDEPAKLCCELKNLMDDEIAAVLEALKQRFDAVEQGAFNFSIMKKGDYSPLKQALRKRNGDWMDSGFSDEILPLMSALKVKCPPPENDEQQRWMDVRCTAQVFNREINRLRGQLCKKPSSLLITHRSQESIIEHVPHHELLERLVKIAPVVKREKQREEVAEEAQVGGEKEPNAVEGEDKGDKKEEQPPALNKVQLLTLKTLATFDARILATAEDVANEMSVSKRISTRTIQPAIHRLVTLGLAERPEGSRQGARVTGEGRRFASTISV